MPNPAKITLIALGLLVVLGGAALLFVNGTDEGSSPPSPAPAVSLERWEEITQRPGFTLLDKAELPDYVICVYDTGVSEVALCYRWKGSRNGPDARSFWVRDDDGQNLQDPERWNQATALNPPGMVAADLYVDGMVIPIRKEHEGDIHVEFTDNLGSELPERVVYSATLRR